MHISLLCLLPRASTSIGRADQFLLNVNLATDYPAMQPLWFDAVFTGIYAGRPERTFHTLLIERNGVEFKGDLNSFIPIVDRNNICPF